MKLGIFRRKFTALIELLRRMSGLIDYFLWLVFDPSKFIIVKNKNIKKILIALVNEEAGNIGGDFCLLGVINCFKKTCPNIGVSILADKNTIKNFGDIPGINMIEYAGRKTLEKIKKEKFNAVFIVNSNELRIRDFIFIPYRVMIFYYSFRDLLNFNQKLFISRKPYIPWRTHMVDMTFRMFESLGFKFPKKQLIFHYSKNDELKVNKFLKKNKIKKFIIIHPGGKFIIDTLQRGKWPPHLWYLDRYAEVADYFSKKGYKVLITGSKKEKILADEINKKSKHGVISCCGFEIRESGYLLSKAKALIATDTSIVHIAYQVEVPIVELMGPSYPKIVGAWPLDSKKHIILFDSGPCSYSMKKIECPENIPCLGGISVKEVIAAADKLLSIN